MKKITYNLLTHLPIIGKAIEISLTSEVPFGTMFSSQIMEEIDINHYTRRIAKYHSEHPKDVITNKVIREIFSNKSP